MNKDCVAAALLNIFEYWANSAIANNPDAIDPWVGERTTKEFESLLLGISTDKQIRNRLHTLQDRGFIEARQPCAHRKTLEYRFMINAVQSALDELKANGQTTVGSGESQRSNNRRVNGQTTVGSGESQRSNNRSTIYKKDNDQEELRENDFSPSHATVVVVESILESPQDESVLEQNGITAISPVILDYTPSTARIESALSQAQIIKNASKIEKYQKLEAQGHKLQRPELIDWANLEIGEYVNLYRKSGCIMTGGSDDINNSYALFVASKNHKKGEEPTMSLGFSVINKCEADSRSWPKLKMWVIEWQKFLKTGNKTGIAETVSREQELQYIHNASKKKFELL